MQPWGISFQVPKGWGHLGPGPGPGTWASFPGSNDLRWVPESCSDKGCSWTNRHFNSQVLRMPQLPWATQCPDLWLPQWIGPSPPRPGGNTTSSPGIGWIRDSSLQVSLKSYSGRQGAGLTSGGFLGKHRMASPVSLPTEEDICPASCCFTSGHSEGQKTWWFTQGKWPCRVLAIPCSKGNLAVSNLFFSSAAKMGPESYWLMKTRHLTLPEFFWFFLSGHPFHIFLPPFICSQIFAERQPCQVRPMRRNDETRLGPHLHHYWWWSWTNFSIFPSFNCSVAKWGQDSTSKCSRKD